MKPVFIFERLWNVNFFSWKIKLIYVLFTDIYFFLFLIFMLFLFVCFFYKYINLDAHYFWNKAIFPKKFFFLSRFLTRQPISIVVVVAVVVKILCLFGPLFGKTFFTESQTICQVCRSYFMCYSYLLARTSKQTNKYRFRETEKNRINFKSTKSKMFIYLYLN